MSIWHSKDEKPIPYMNVVMEFDKPYGDQLSNEEQDPAYECVEMKYYGDGDGHEWKWLKQCNRWAYLEDLVQCSEDILNIINVFLREKPEFKDWIKINFNI